MSAAVAAGRLARPAPARAAPRLSVVRPAGRARRAAGGRAVALAATAALFASVGLHALIAQGQLTLDRLGAARHAEQRRYEQLRLQVAQEEAPATIVARAAELGLVPVSGRPVGVAGYRQAGAEGEAPAEDPSPATRAGAWQRMKRHLAAAP